MQPRPRPRPPELHATLCLTPLTRLTVSRAIKSVSRREAQTKAGAVRLVPVHPTLEAMLAAWHTAGETKGRATRALIETRTPLWGLPHFRPLLLAPTPARLRSLALALVAEGVGALWRGTTFEALALAGVIGGAFPAADEVAAHPRTEPLPFRRALLDTDR